MVISDKGIAFIKQWEKLELTPYECSAGHKTVGYGLKVLPTEIIDEITEQQADMILVMDLANAQRTVHEVDAPLTQNEYDALVSFMFNVGSGAFRTSTLLKKLNQGDKAGASNEILKWCHIKKEVSKGLLKRREQEKAIFDSGIYAEEH